MRMAGIDAADVSAYTARLIGFSAPRTVPSAWGAGVPPLTLTGRHTRLDDYVVDNPWRPPRHGVFLDIGCGYPPFTTVETARRLTRWRVIGADPAFAYSLVYDEDGRYALFDDQRRLRYAEAGNVDPDTVTTRARFDALLADLLAGRQRPGARLVTDPGREFEEAGLTLLQGGIGDVDIAGGVDVIRCMNVLMYYNQPFRLHSLAWATELLRPDGLLICGSNWVQSTSSRYTVYQKRGDTLVPREFAFGIENVRPIELAPWYALHDDNLENRANAHAVGVLRDDANFRSRYDAMLDATLARLDICARDAAGYLGDTGDRSPDELAAAAATVADALTDLVDDAVTVLSRSGYGAWRNSAGHIAMTPFPPPPLPHRTVVAQSPTRRTMDPPAPGGFA